jgi:threonylcarbamoyladenosine tRNA methylthiotransferase MtaB
MKSFCVKTLGCKVNQCDSEHLRQKLLSLGFKEDFSKDKVDLVLVNTCCVTAVAERKSRQAIREAARRAQGNPVVVVGCYASYDKKALEAVDGVTAVFGHQEKEGFYAWLEGLKQDHLKEPNDPVLRFQGRTRAFLKVQDGCDNRCGYCVVPYVRGPSRSRGFQEILEEVSCYCGAGYQEIVLTGVCLGAFGRDLKDKVDLVDLIEEIEKLEGVKRVRLSSIEAMDVTDRLLEKMAVSGKLCPHLHIPFQSGDDGVLKAMDKRPRVKDYLKIVKTAKETIKDLAITTDVIVGFPQEDERAFENSLRFLEEVVPLRVHIFPYSFRRGTAVFKKQLARSTVQGRLLVLKDLTKSLAERFKKDFLDKEAEVLFEEEQGGFWQGYSRNYIKVRVKSDVTLSNVLTRVRLLELKDDAVLGVIAGF